MKNKRSHLRYIATALVGMTMASQALAEEPYCREFTQTFTVAGETQQGYGTACLQPDGAWKIMKQDDMALESNVTSNVPTISKRPQRTAKYVVRDEVIYIVPRRAIVSSGRYSNHYAYKHGRRNRY